MSEIESDEIDSSVEELIQVLEAEAERREALTDHSTAWAIRQHIREICSTDIDNLLCLVQLSIELDLFADETLEKHGILSQLRSKQSEVNPELLRQVLEAVLKIALPSPSILELVEACTDYLSPEELMCVLLPALVRFGYNCTCPAFAAELGELYLRIDPDNIEFLSHLAPLYQNAKNYDRGIQVARRRYELVDQVAEKIFSNQLVLRGLLGAGGYWEQALKVAKHHESLLQTLIEQQPNSLDSLQLCRLFNIGYFLVYFSDQPQRWRKLQNQLSQFLQNQVQSRAGERGNFAQSKKSSITSLSQNHTTKPLKVGYLSHCMANHSVGWLARSLIRHHDHDRFEIHGYFVNYRELNDPLQDWYVNQVDYAHRFSTPHIESYLEIAEQIHQDEIDILIDLDSITLDLSCEVLALKPAPIQATWLGWDASGLPAIDYFIADPYVLPESAQDYYSEKIWRLPQTYIAVDGFEVGVPTLRREDFNIPQDAVIFLSAQRGYKRHRDHVKLQMQIVKQISNSYFLIKGLSDEKAVQKFFLEIAEKEGVAEDQLRFLSSDPSSEVHRANLAIADVVLDTFPYNGATTTLETLWMGIPIVTRVGEQFAARNSYTMMKNAGISEGIAWTDAEYVEWGVRLGTDAALRQKIHWDLMRSRQSAPLWNAKQFTHEMEKAYTEMYALKFAST